MASYSHVSFAYDGYNPGGPLDDVAHLEFPFDWDVVADCTSNLTWYQPWETTRDLCHAMHWIVKGLEVSLSIDWDTTRSASFSGGIARVYTDHTPIVDEHLVVDEHDLRNPGIVETDDFAGPEPSPTKYYGVLNADGWDGPGSTGTLELTIHVMSKMIVESQNIPHFTWQEDGAALQPSFWITGSMQLATPGSEYSWFFTNSPLGTDDPVSISFLSGSGGGSVTVSFSVSDSYDSFSLTITVGDTFDWAP